MFLFPEGSEFHKIGAAIVNDLERNTKINEKRNGVITLLWQLRLQENPDHKKISSLYNTAVVIFFYISTHADIVDVQT